MARYQKESEMMTMLAFFPYKVIARITVSTVKFSFIFIGMLHWYLLVFSFVAILLALRFTLKCAHKESATLSQLIHSIVKQMVGPSVGRTVDSDQTDGPSVGSISRQYFKE